MGAEFFERKKMSIFVKSLKELPHAIDEVQNASRRQMIISAMKENVSNNAEAEIVDLAEFLLERVKGDNNGD